MTIVAGKGTRALCEALDRDRLSVERRGDRMIVRPAVLVTGELLEQLTRYKPELLAALRQLDELGEPRVLRPCAGCDQAFAVAPKTDCCPWCDAADVFGRRPYRPRALTGGQFGGQFGDSSQPLLSPHQNQSDHTLTLTGG